MKFQFITMQKGTNFIIYSIISSLITLTASESANNEALSLIIDEFWAWRIREWPDFGSKIGITTYNDKIENYTEAAFTEQKNSAEVFIQRLKGMDRNSLIKGDQVSYDILLDLLTVFKNGYNYRKYSIYNYMSALDHIMYRYSFMLRIMPKSTFTDYSNIIARYRLISIQLRDMIELMKVSVNESTTVHITTVNSTIRSIEKELSSDMALFNNPFRDESCLPLTIEESKRLQLQQEAQGVIDDIRMALTAYANFLKNEYYPHARVEPGVGSLPGGQEYYVQCLQWHITANWTPYQVHQKGLHEVVRIQSKMKGIMKQNGFDGSVKEYIDHLKQDPQTFYNTSEEMLTKYSEIVDRVHKKLHMVFHDVPEDPIQVLSSPQRVSRYSGPTPDGSQMATFWADVKYPREKPKYSMTALTLHEAVPGHHLQSMLMKRNNLPLFRRHTEYLRYNAVPFNWLFNTAYGEGWALYAESLGEEMGVYTERLDMFGRYSSEIFRAARLVVDTGIHAYGWSIEEAESYLLNNTAMGPKSIKNEVLRYLSWPGQACAYKIGELKIKELRRHGETELGSRFDLKDFHREVLSLGAAPLTIVEQQIKEWIENEKTTSSGNLIQYNSISVYTGLTFIIIAAKCLL